MLLDKDEGFIFVASFIYLRNLDLAIGFNDDAITWGCSNWCEVVRRRLPL